MNKFAALKFDDDNDTVSDKDDEEHQQNGNNGSDIKQKDEEDQVTKYEFSPPPEVPNGEHKLQYPYSFWFSRRYTKLASTTNYESSIKLIGSFSSLQKDLMTCPYRQGKVEQFWAFYSHMVRPGDLPGNSNIHLFKHGIRPMWEDESNKEGGKWILRLRKGLASRCWENLILAMLGEQFMVESELCGAVVSNRFQDDIITVWNKNAADQITMQRIRDTVRRVLNLPQNTVMKYKAHSDCPNYRSSFGNTSL